MEFLWNNLPWLLAMLVLIGCSAFFSASEAALFSLQGPDRRSMEQGSPGERAAYQLLGNPDQLLSAVLFWNLLVNITYFAITTMLGTRWEGSQTANVVFAAGSLLAIIFLSEMLPKSLGVLNARSAASMLALPMLVAVRIADPIMPALRTVNLLSRRLIWPGLEEQPHLDFRDLERAIALSQSDPERKGDEKIVLQNIVQLSSLQAQEWMRPRKVIHPLVPPVHIEQLQSTSSSGGYLLIAGDDGDEIVAAWDLRELTPFTPKRLDLLARPVAVVPWCATIGDVLETLGRESAQVAAVVNERGETIGSISLRDVLDAVLTVEPHRGERLLDHKPIVPQTDGTWQVDGMTNVRRLNNLVESQLPSTHHVTLGGVVQETLEHLPQTGDACQWGPFDIRVLKVTNATELLLHVALRPKEDSPES